MLNGVDTFQSNVLFNNSPLLTITESTYFRVQKDVSQ